MKTDKPDETALLLLYMSSSDMRYMMQGVVGVVTCSVPDVLCHAAVRARNSAVLLAACTDEEELASVTALNGQQVVMQAAQV